MLSVNYISEFLNKEQKDIQEDVFLKLKVFEKKENINLNDVLKKNKEEVNTSVCEETNKKSINNGNSSNKDDTLTYSTKKNYISLYDSFDNYLDHNYGFLKTTSCKSNNNIFTFFSSLFMIGNEEYQLFDYQEKLSLVKKCIKKIDDELFLENHYEKYEYNKNKYFNKEKILNVLKEAFQLRTDDYFNLMIQHIANYLGVNIFIFEIKNRDIVSKLVYKSNKYKIKNHCDVSQNEFNKYLPHFILIKEDDMYQPIVKINNSSNNYLTYEDDYNQKIFKRLHEFECNLNSLKKSCTIQFHKLKVDELRDYALKEKISITKLSEKTNKEIKKKKDELIEDLKAHYSSI